jgi:hypothetical protein
VDDTQRCEVSDRFNDGPWLRCPHQGHLVMSWNPELADIEEEMLCDEHERLMYEAERDSEEGGDAHG